MSAEPISYTSDDDRRDRKLRNALLLVLYTIRGHSVDGAASAGFLVNKVTTACRPLRFASDAHAMGLLRDLVHLGYATELTNGDRRPGEAFGLDWARFGITAAGTERYLSGRPFSRLMDDVDALKGEI